jgi:hypothetical protein
MKQAQINKIANNKKITHCYIYKRGYYRPDHCGYTDRQTRAGVYSKQEAIDEAQHCDEVTIIPIDIAEHNKNIVEEIKELSTRLI